MKTSKITTLLFIMVFIFSSAMAQKLPSKTEVMASMVLTNGYFMNKWPDPGKSIITNKERPSNIWTRAVYYEGLMALYNLKQDKSYYDYAV